MKAAGLKVGRQSGRRVPKERKEDLTKGKLMVVLICPLLPLIYPEGVQRRTYHTLCFLAASETVSARVKLTARQMRIRDPSLGVIGWSY